MIVLQNAGIERTSVTHAALVVGAAPVLVALLAAGLGWSVSRPLTWGGYALALAGIAFVARAGGGDATAAGDLLVLASVAVSAAFIVVQPALLRGRDPAAVTAVQFAAGGLLAMPVAALIEGAPPRRPGRRRSRRSRRSPWRDAGAVLAVRLRRRRASRRSSRGRS